MTRRKRLSANAQRLARERFGLGRLALIPQHVGKHAQRHQAAGSVVAHAGIGILERILQIVDDAAFPGGVHQNVGGHGSLRFVLRTAEDLANLSQMGVG